MFLKKKKESSVVVEDMYDALCAYSVKNEKVMYVSPSLSLVSQGREVERGRKGKHKHKHSTHLPKMSRGQIQGYKDKKGVVLSYLGNERYIKYIKYKGMTDKGFTGGLVHEG